MSFVAICLFAALSVMEGIPCPDYSNLEQYPVYITYYWPDAGGINCWQDCSILADNKPWNEEDYGKVAACPMELYYQRLTITYIGTVHCRDTGPAVKVKYRPDLGGWVVSIDVLERVGVWTYGNWLISDWEAGW